METDCISLKGESQGEPPLDFPWTIIFFDENLRISQVKNYPENFLFSLSPEGLTGVSVNDLKEYAAVPNRKAAGLLAGQIVKSQQEKRSVSFESAFLKEKGEWSPIFCYTACATDGCVSCHIMTIDKRDLKSEGACADKPAEEASLKFENLFNALEAGVEYYNAAGELMETNRYMEELLGMDKETLCALKTNLFTKRYIPDVAKELIRAGKRSFSTCEYDFDEIARRNEGYKTSKRGKMSLEIRTSPIYNSGGELTGTFVMLFDASEYTRLQKRYELLYNQNETILQSLPVGVEMYSCDGVLQYLNDRDCEIFGVNRKDVLLGGDININNNPNLPQELKDAVREKRRVHLDFPYDFGAVHDTGYYLSSHPNEVKRIDCDGTPVINSEGETENYLFIVNDITDYYIQSRILEEMRQNLIYAMKAGDANAWTLDLKTKTLLLLEYENPGKKALLLETVLCSMHPDDRKVYLETIEAISTGQIEHAEMVLRYFSKKDGDYRYYDNRMGARKNAQGIITHITGIERNITEKSIQKLELENARKSLGLAMEAADIKAWIYDMQSRKSKVLYGQAGNDEGKTDFSLFVHPDDKEVFKEHYRSVSEGRKSKDSIIVRGNKEGVYRHYESTISSVRNEEGAISHLIGSLKDVTDALSTQRELKRQKDFISLALSAGNMAVWIYDIGEEAFSSLEGNALAGERLTMEQNLSLLHPDDAVSFLSRFQSVIEEHVPKLNLKLRYRDESVEGGYRHYESSIIPIRNEWGKITHLTGTQKDVTNDYFQQEELRQSKLKTDLAIRTSGIVLWEFDNRTGLFTCYNEPINGYDESKKLSTGDYFNATHPDDLEIIKSNATIVAEGRDESLCFDVRMRYPNDPEWYYCTISGSPFEKESNGKVVKYAGFRRDNTELQRKRTLLSNILNNVPVPIHIKDVEDNQKYVFWNEESKKLFGDATEKTLYSVVDAEQAEKIDEIDRRVFETGEPYLGQEKVLTLEGKEYDTIVRKCIIYENGKRLLLGVRWDAGLQNELQLKSKILSISMDALQAYTWYYDSRDGVLVFGDGFEKTGGDRTALNSVEKFAGQIHEEDRERFTSLMSNFLQKEEGEFAVEYRIDLANTGDYDWWECRGTMETMRRDNVTYKYMFGMDINISGHKRTELDLLHNKTELAKLNKQNELVLNNTNSGLAYITKDYVVQWENINIHSTDLPIRYKKGEVCYRSTHGRNSPCEFCVMTRALQTKQMEQSEFDFDDGRSIEVFAMPVFNEKGETEGAVLRVDDISERKGMIRDLQKAKMQAEQSDKLKSAFLANMSHEIRTPLNAIVGFSDLMTVATDNEEREEYSKIIKTNNELLLKLINDILDLSKIEAGSVVLKYERFDMAEHFDEVATAMRRRISNPAIRFISKNPYRSCIIKSDKSRLTQILTNYVTNSIKYTERGYIEMGYEHTGEAIRLYVRDSGIGISDDKRHRVFHRFEKLDEFAQGTGLGLSICKAIAETFGGSVGFDSHPGEGSVFWATIPCAAEVVLASEESAEMA
ncbi:MAG: PAS domain S-box protein [Bacteroidales bacterium]|nr:PAS domain S-box protein [Bacteroidales bacterium]